MSEVSKYGFYQEFAQNRERSAFRRLVPFAVTFGVIFPPGMVIAANPYAAGEFITEHPELSILLTLANAALAGTGTAALIQCLDITRINSTNGIIAQQIARMEGRDPQTKAEINKEIEHVKQTVTLASRISPTPGHLFDLIFNHHLARIRSRKHPEVLEEQAISDRRMQNWSLRSIERVEGYPVEPRRVTEALLLAERRWANLIEDDMEPEYIRRYGGLMKGEIQRKLADHLASPAWGEFERRRARYETMSYAELGQELKRLVGDFPVVSFSVDDIWQRRDKSPEKKRLFEQIRHLVARSPGTRGFQEVLLRELSNLYNRGLDTTVSNPIEVPLLNTVGLGEDTIDGNIFDPGYVEEAERRLYGFLQERDRIKWNPIYYDSSYESKPLKRWLLNRGLEVCEATYLACMKLLPAPPLESSWQSQYKAKYKKSLKA